MSKKPIKYKAPSESVLLKLKERFESTVRLNNDGKNYTAEDIDHLLNYWFSGRSHKAIAQDLGRPISTIQNKVNKLLRGYSKADKAYQPTKERLSRVGAPWSLLDGRAVAITFRYMGRGPAATEHVARVLGRSTEEIDKYMNKKKGFIRDENEQTSKPSPLALPDPVSLQATLCNYGEETNNRLAALNKKITSCEAMLTKLIASVEGLNNLVEPIQAIAVSATSSEPKPSKGFFVIAEAYGKNVWEYVDKHDDLVRDLQYARKFDTVQAARNYIEEEGLELDGEETRVLHYRNGMIVERHSITNEDELETVFMISRMARAPGHKKPVRKYYDPTDSEWTLHPDHLLSSEGVFTTREEALLCIEAELEDEDDRDGISVIEWKDGNIVREDVFDWSQGYSSLDDDGDDSDDEEAPEPGKWYITAKSKKNKLGITKDNVLVYHTEHRIRRIGHSNWTTSPQRALCFDTQKKAEAWITLNYDNTTETKEVRDIRTKCIETHG